MSSTSAGYTAARRSTTTDHLSNQKSIALYQESYLKLHPPTTSLLKALPTIHPHISSAISTGRIVTNSPLLVIFPDTVSNLHFKLYLQAGSAQHRLTSWTCRTRGKQQRRLVENTISTGSEMKLPLVLTSRSPIWANATSPWHERHRTKNGSDSLNLSLSGSMESSAPKCRSSESTTLVR